MRFFYFVIAAAFAMNTCNGWDNKLTKQDAKKLNKLVNGAVLTFAKSHKSIKVKKLAKRAISAQEKIGEFIGYLEEVYGPMDGPPRTEKGIKAAEIKEKKREKKEKAEEKGPSFAISDDVPKITPEPEKLERMADKLGAPFDKEFEKPGAKKPKRKAPPKPEAKKTEMGPMIPPMPNLPPLPSAKKPKPPAPPKLGKKKKLPSGGGWGAPPPPPLGAKKPPPPPGLPPMPELPSMPELPPLPPM
ncbi:hypothetical protein HOD08_00285 [bacterium]|jgi:hypothetical protein|nr:hypothetical protein [bacterium]